MTIPMTDTVNKLAQEALYRELRNASRALHPVAQQDDGDPGYETKGNSQ